MNSKKSAVLWGLAGGLAVLFIASANTPDDNAQSQTAFEKSCTSTSSAPMGQDVKLPNPKHCSKIIIITK